MQALSLTAPQVARTFKVTPLPRWFSLKAISVRQLARSPPPVMDAYFKSWPSCARRHFLLRCPAATYPLGRILRQPAPVSFFWKETGAHTTAAAHIERGFAAILLMTTGVTNTEVTSNSDVDDGAADHGSDCTWLTVRHAPVIASLPSPDSGSRGAGLVSQRSLHPPTSLEVFRRSDHEMPKLPVVRSRQSRVSGHPHRSQGP